MSLMLDCFSYLGACGRAFAEGWDMPEPRAVQAALADARRRRMARTLGTPRLRRRTEPRLRLLTTRQLNRLLIQHRIPGRSKARTKTQKIQLLARSGITLS
jgi:hypothetical protein